MTNLRFLFTAAWLLCSVALFAKDATTSIEPPFWWAGMNNPQLQLMVHSPNINSAVPSINYPGITIDSVARLDGPNYQFIYLNVTPDAKPGKFDITFKNGKKTIKVPYELKKRDGVMPNTFSSADVLYLIMPDRFADGNYKNNVIPTLNNPEPIDRNNPNSRHGGDLKGIADHLNYIDSLGVTAIWLNPVLENDMPGGSYHGYATTDYYKIDPRLGSNEEYKALIETAHNRDIKVVMDMIFNHSGLSHKWVKDSPSSDWFNYPKGDKFTNFRLSTINDPYSSDYDRTRSVKGWFVPSMPDLNQENPHLMKYLIQNSIWWIEYSKIDGIRMDTYPYADIKPMAQWVEDVHKEYPGYNIVGEAWYGDVAGTAFWQSGSRLNKLCDTKLPTIMDFPTMIIANKAFNDTTTLYGRGLNEIYNRLSLDYLYENPQNVLTFLDNHDSDRFLLKAPKDLGAWKQAIAFLLTTRGTPQIYYGTELLMSGDKKISDGNVRKDIPGGFPGDKVNEFTPAGRSEMQNEAYNFISKLSHWRKGNNVISEGKMKHFMPENGLYVYERSLNGKSVIVIMNGNDFPITVDMGIYAETLKPGTTLTDVITGQPLTINPKITFGPRALYVLE